MDTDTKLTVIFLVAAFVAAPVIIWVELAVTRRRNRQWAERGYVR